MRGIKDAPASEASKAIPKLGPVSRSRIYPTQLPALGYPSHFLVKRVTSAGTIRFKHKLLFLASSLHTHHVGLEESADGAWSLFLGQVLLGHIEERTMTVSG